MVGRRAIMKTQNLTKLIFTFTLSLILIPSLFSCLQPASASINTTQDTTDSNATFNLRTFNSDITSFVIRDYNTKKVLGTVTGGDPPYHDPNHVYPDVDCWSTKPFFVDAAGNVVYSPEEYAKILVAPGSHLDVEFSDGSQKVLTMGHVAVDIATKTIANVGNPAYKTYYMSPLKDITWLNNPEIFGKWDGNTFVAEPIGVILATTDTGVAPWRHTWELGSTELTKAKISTSLEDFNNQATMYANLRSKYGNTRVEVIPKLKLDALENLITYNYTSVVNSQTFQIYTNTTQMAIIDTQIVPTFNKYGKVANYIAPSTVQVNVPVTGAVAEPHAAVDPTSNYVAEKQLQQRVDLKAWWKYSSTTIEQDITGYAYNPTRLTTDITYPTSINFDSFGLLKKTANVEFATALQPHTTVYYATYTGQAIGYAWNGNIFSGPYEKVFQYPISAKFPYRLKIENVYIVNRVVFTFLLLTDNIVKYIPADGVPVDVDDITEYAINDVGTLNPDWDDIEGGTIMITHNPFEGAIAWWEQNWGFIVFFVTAGMVFVAVIIMAIYSPKALQNITSFIPRKEKRRAK